MSSGHEHPVSATRPNGTAERPTSADDTRPVRPDLTGREHMTRNVLASWAGHSVFIIAGFVLPRIVDRRIGQDALGIWDFGWSLVIYFELVSAGVRGSVSRYVARYRAAGDPRMVNTTVSTGLAIYACGSVIVLGLTVAASVLLPKLFGLRFAGKTTDAQWVVLFLGLSLVLQFLYAVFSGVITACHRWGVHNGIHAGIRFLTAAGMIASLCFGGGLVGMGAIVLAGELLAGVLRYLAARRFLPELRLSPRMVSLRHAAELLRFGGKSLLDAVARVLTYQTTHVMIVAYLGPAALALYARPMALVRHVSKLMNKLAYVFTPTASALHAQQHQSQAHHAKGRREIAELAIKGARYSLLIALPAVIILSLAGSSLLRVWMGPRYALGTVLAVLALGHMAMLSQRTTYQILMGMGRHGLPALANLAAALVTGLLCFLALGVFGWGLIGAAAAVVLPMTVVHSIIVPLYACRVLGISYGRFVARTATIPAVLAIPLIAVLVGARFLWPGNPARFLGWGIGLGGLLLCPFYYRYAIPDGIRRKVSAAVWLRPV